MEQVKKGKSKIMTRGQRGATSYLDNNCTDEQKSEISDIWRFTG